MEALAETVNGLLLLVDSEMGAGRCNAELAERVCVVAEVVTAHVRVVRALKE
jgi:hypothetical protein